MDTSETYIKMCERAEEIQSLRREEHNSDTGKWKPGDYWIHITSKKPHIVEEYRDAWADIPLYIHHPIECIWLPTQDQLQEMVGGFEAGMIDWCEWEHNVYPETKSPFVHLFNSFEQLWLAFVMKETYKKVWDGSGWILNERQENQ